MLAWNDRVTSLLAYMSDLQSCAVAFSGGVDSAVVASAAYRSLGDRAVAVTGVSASLAAHELEVARQVAHEIGIRHELLRTEEFSKTDYVKNAPDRCFHCKNQLYLQVEPLKQRLGIAEIVSGTNLDDLGDYRPGLQAADHHGVRSPLVDCQFNKADVRRLAREWELSVWDKPAAPCLSSRVAYGEEVTPQRLRMIELAEQFLRERGLGPIRVRYHKDDMARIEVSGDQIRQLAEEPLRSRLVTRFAEIGFRFVSVDLAGFKSGNLNQLVPLQDLNSDLNSR